MLSGVSPEVSQHLYAHVMAMAGPAVQELVSSSVVDPRYLAVVEKLQKLQAEQNGLLARVAAAEVERNKKVAEAATVNRDLEVHVNANIQWQAHNAQLIDRLSALQKPLKASTPPPIPESNSTSAS